MQCFYLHNVSLNVQLNMSCPCSRLCRESDHLSTQFQRPSPEMWYELQRYTCLKRNSILSRFSWRIIVALYSFTSVTLVALKKPVRNTLAHSDIGLKNTNHSLPNFGKTNLFSGFHYITLSFCINVIHAHFGVP